MILLDAHKIQWHADRVNEWLAGKRVYPITIDCAIDKRCTYECAYCFGKFQRNDYRLLSKEVITDFLTDCSSIGVKGVSFVSDGESTCNKHLYHAITYGKSLGIDMALGTNGYLLDDNQLDEILPALTYLRFNISAGLPERYAFIHGVEPKCFHKVVGTIKKCVEIKRKRNLDVTIGTQMVLMPKYGMDIIPLARLARDLEVDYLVIKHCADMPRDENKLGIVYSDYDRLKDVLLEAESYSTERTQISVKWSKIADGNTKSYTRCYGPPFQLQMSGNGLVAPCGSFFETGCSKYHIGNITEQRFIDIVRSDRYWEVMDHLASDQFDAVSECANLCLQHKINGYLDALKKSGITHIDKPEGKEPMHINFI